MGLIESGNHPVRRFIATPHYSRFYFYAEHTDGSVTLFDVTDAAPVREWTAQAPT